MSDEAWGRARRVLNDLLEADPDDPAAWLEAHCDDPALRTEVRGLLRAYEGGVLSAEDAAGDWVTGAGRDAPDPGRLQGQTIGPYRLTEEIGVGGMSVVYRAERTGDYEQTVAVKLLQRRLHASGAEQRFRAERQVLASLDHPHIAGLLDGGVTEGGRPYLVMELVDGVPITEYADEQDLDLEARLDLLEQVLDAVEAAHRQLVVHRDLKPSNVLVTEAEKGTPQVKLLDFGIAKLLDDSLPVTRPQTETGHHLMTPAYAAPEQVAGEEITTATDVYQLGVLAYELLAGTRPFDLEGKSLTEIERILREVPPAAPSDRGGPRAAALAGDLDTIVQTALRKEPGERYRSVEALAADLGRSRRGEPIEARPATLRYRARKFVTRNRAGVGVAAAFLALVALAGTLLVQQRNRAQRSAERARENTQRAQREAATAEQVSDFLVNLFSASNPYTQSDSLLATDLLRRGRKRIDSLDLQPVVKARLLEAMGNAYGDRGNYAASDSLLRQALELRRAHQGPAHRDVARAYVELSGAERSAYEYESALRYARKARSILATHEAPQTRADSLLWADALNAHAEGLENTGAPDSAETLIRRAVSIRTAVHGPDHRSVWRGKRTLASILREQKRFAEGHQLYRDLLARERTQEDSLGLAGIHNDLGYLLDSWGKPARAERHNRKALQLFERHLGPAHATTLVARGNNLGASLVKQNEYGAREKALREQLRVVRDRYPPDHWRVGKWAGILGRVLLHRGHHLDEAEALLRERLRIYEALDYSRSTIAEAQAPLGRCLAAQGQFRRARPLLETSYAVLTADSTQNVDTTAQTHAEVGLGLYQMQRRSQYARAESLMTAAHAALDAKYNELKGVDENLMPVRRVEQHLADLYEAWGKPEQAEKYRPAQREPTRARAQ
jgi:serine/threonine-protein kinase